MCLCFYGNSLYTGICNLDTHEKIIVTFLMLCVSAFLRISTLLACLYVLFIFNMHFFSSFKFDALLYFYYLLISISMLFARFSLQRITVMHNLILDLFEWQATRVHTQTAPLHICVFVNRVGLSLVCYGWILRLRARPQFRSRRVVSRAPCQFPDLFLLRCSKSQSLEEHIETISFSGSLAYSTHSSHTLGDCRSSDIIKLFLYERVCVFE